MPFHIGQRPIPWTPQDEELAKKLLEARATEAEFQEKLGRSKAASYAHFYYLKHGDKNRPDRIRLRPSRGKNIVGEEGASADVVLSYARPAVQLLEEAKQRLLAPRSITAMLCGDPPPGYSALDKKQRQNA